MNYASKQPHPARQMTAFLAWTCALLILNPPMAIAAVGVGEVQGFLGGVTGFLTGPMATSVLIIAVVVCGVMWFANRQNSGGQTLGRIAIAGALIMFAGPIIKLVGPNQTGAIM